MLTKDDLGAIKEIIQGNNKILGTIIKIELAETNKRIIGVAQNTKELMNSQERLEYKIDKLDYEARIKQLEKRLKALEVIVEGLKVVQ